MSHNKAPNFYNDAMKTYGLIYVLPSSLMQKTIQNMISDINDKSWSEVIQGETDPQEACRGYYPREGICQIGLAPQDDVTVWENIFGEKPDDIELCYMLRRKHVNLYLPMSPRDKMEERYTMPQSERMRRIGYKNPRIAIIPDGVHKDAENYLVEWTLCGGFTFLFDDNKDFEFIAKVGETPFGDQYIAKETLQFYKG